MAEWQAWQLVVAGASIILAIAGVNVGAVKWLLGLQESFSQTSSKRIAELESKNAERWTRVEHDLLQLHANLPLEYVRREDWLRFGNTLEAKIDAIRAEMREQLAELRRE
jgi:hypothetical protein